LVLIYVINEQSFGWTIQFHWPVGLLLGALGLIYVSSVAAGVYPARMGVRMDAAEGVR
jgi:putative ABC transport system permease protein